MRLALAWFGLWVLGMRPEWHVRVTHKVKITRSRDYGSGRKLGAARGFYDTALEAAEFGDRVTLEVRVRAREREQTPPF